MIELRALDFAVLEEIEFGNQNGFRPSVASLSGDLETRVGLLDTSLGDLVRKGLITGSGSIETKRYQITPKGQERLLAGPSIVPSITDGEMRRMESDVI
jgi:DNA-binding PadR family transcriptional regulator